MEENAQEIVEKVDVIEVKEPHESNDNSSGMGLPDINLPSMELDMGLGLEF